MAEVRVKPCLASRFKPCRLCLVAANC
jgi:hypothetical protein